jgi:hypothetical protein
MTMPTSLRAYSDCEALYEQAQADPKGCRAQFATEASAIHMRTRMHQFRKLDRDYNATLHPPDDPRHGTSAYDDYECRIFKDEDGVLWWLYVEPRSARVLVVEGLSDVGGFIEGSVVPEQQQLEDKSNA